MSDEYEDIVDEWLIMIQDCEDRRSQLTNWEKTFIQSLSEQINRGPFLSPKQESRLNDIWERVTERG